MRYRGVDLSTGEQNRYQIRVSEARTRAKGLGLPPPRLYVWPPDDPNERCPFRPNIWLRNDGTISLAGVEPAWDSFRPMSNGQASLSGSKILEAHLQNGVLAVLTIRPKEKHPTFHVFRSPRRPAPVVVEEGVKVSLSGQAMALSEDGRRLGLCKGMSHVTVHEIDSWGQPPLLKTLRGKFHPDLTVIFLPDHPGLVVCIGGHERHLIHWARAGLELRPFHAKIAAGTSNSRMISTWQLSDSVHRSLSRGLADLVHLDPNRFAIAAWPPITVALDRYGQLAIFDLQHRLVCMFFVFRDQIGAWMPDGTRHGSASIIGGPPTKGALDKIGVALCKAWESGNK
jgi:hypothetical protein